MRRLPVLAQRLCRRRAKLTLFARVEKSLELHAAAARGATVARWWFEVPVQGGEVAGELGVGGGREGAVLAGQEEEPVPPALLQLERGVGLTAVVLWVVVAGGGEGVGLSALQA